MPRFPSYAIAWRRVPAAHSDRPVATFRSTPMYRPRRPHRPSHRRRRSCPSPCRKPSRGGHDRTARHRSANSFHTFPSHSHVSPREAPPRPTPSRPPKEDHVTTGRVIYHCRPPTSRWPLFRRQLPGFTVPFPRVRSGELRRGRNLRTKPFSRALRRKQGHDRSSGRESRNACSPGPRWWRRRTIRLCR